MQELVEQIVNASKRGPLFVAGRAERWAGCAYDDGAGGVVWVELGLWLQDMVSNHPMHEAGRPVDGCDGRWVCDLQGECVPLYAAPRWHRDVDHATREWSTMPAG